LDPGYDEGFYTDGVTCVGLDDLSTAVKAFRRTLDINPDHAHAHNNLGYLLEQQGQVDEARSHYQRAL